MRILRDSVRVRVNTTRASLTSQVSLAAPRRTPGTLISLYVMISYLVRWWYRTNKLLPASAVPVEIMPAASISRTMVFVLMALIGCLERSHESS